jgi:hypothetical protein
MSLSRKHYNEISEILRETLIEYNSKNGELIFKEDLKRQLLSFLKRDNRNFDKERFIEASNLYENGSNNIEYYKPKAHYGDEPKHISTVLETALEELNIKA